VAMTSALAVGVNDTVFPLTLTLPRMVSTVVPQVESVQDFTVRPLVALAMDRLKVAETMVLVMLLPVVPFAGLTLLTERGTAVAVDVTVGVSVLVGVLLGVAVLVTVDVFVGTGV